MDPLKGRDYGHVLVIGHVDEDQTLVIQEGRKPYQGLRLCGGKIEHGETPAQAAAREFFEEIGVPVSPEEMVLVFTTHRPKRDGTGMFASYLFQVKLTRDRLPNTDSWIIPGDAPNSWIRSYVEKTSIFASALFNEGHRKRIEDAYAYRLSNPK